MDLTDLVKKAPTKKSWEAIGLKHHHGINTPLFSIRTEKSCGIGEFFDLSLLIQWCCSLGFTIIQLLPLNDTGEDPSPYNALSAFALNPIYLSLWALPFVQNNPALQKKINGLRGYNLLKRVPYRAVLAAKMAFLKSYFHYYIPLFKQDKAYLFFVETTTWLQPYALFKVLKKEYRTVKSSPWPIDTKHSLEALYEKKKEQMEFYYLLQYLSFSQLKKMKAYANKKGIFFKGDLPILISPNSLDVWLHRKEFNFNFAAGSPPDIFNPKGQYWGFPLYRWEVIKEQSFTWWKRRLSVAAHLYDLFRVDHILGFYRIWAIPRGKKASSGFFSPSDEKTALEQGESILTTLFSATDRLPIGEDLGLPTPSIRQSLHNLAIPGTKIPRWQKNIPYPPLSLTTLSTHDTETLRQWWTRLPEEAQASCHFYRLPFKPCLDRQTRSYTLHHAHHTASFFHINLLQEYLSLNQRFSCTNPDDERINIPGKILDTNWSYRYPSNLEEITSDLLLTKEIKAILQ